MIEHRETEWLNYVIDANWKMTNDENATQEKITFKPWYITQYGQEAYDELRKDNKAFEKARKAYWYQQNAETRKARMREYKKQYYQTNVVACKDRMREYFNQYYQTPAGRAANLANNYKREDDKYGRENNITASWILNKIFNSKCYYCGESDWKKLGCDRINNSIGHITTNVVCSCGDCNLERQKMPFREYCKKKGVA